MDDVPARRPRIIHVSGDFPDCFDASKTPVIQSLLQLTASQFDHEVFSLNRRSPGVMRFAGSLVARAGVPGLEIHEELFSAGTAVIYEAPPRGLYHATMLRQLGDWVAAEIESGPHPALLVGHKLAIEGIAVRRAAQQLGLPFAICIQGDTDTKVLEARPDLSAEFRRIFHDAAIVFPFTPWALAAFETRFGPREGPTIVLPCPTDLDQPIPPRPAGHGLISVFHLKNFRRKNLRGMASALRLLRQAGDSPPLEIIGGGSGSDIARCQSIVAGLEGVVMPGPLGREALTYRLNQATAFVLPSLRESFGLVFIEALFAGLPVIYPRGAAIDGYFDGHSFAIGVDPRDPAALAGTIRHAVHAESLLKSELLEWQQSSEARRFQRGAIGGTFAAGLSTAIGAAQPAP